MSHSESNASLNYQGLALTSLVVGGIAAGIGLTNIEPAQAENPRVSVAVTNIQSNLNSQSFAAEIVAPATNFYFTGASVDVTYVNATNVSGAGTDASQIVVTTGTMNATSIALDANTFESATARAINNALTESRYGDIIGLVNAYNGPPAGAENPSVSVALTNIQSNTSSQNFAAEIVAPMTDVFFTSVTAAVTYENATSASIGGSDASQFLINTGSISGATQSYTATSVETATADAIDTLNTNGRIGDVIGIVKAWQGGGSAALD